MRERNKTDVTMDSVSAEVLAGLIAAYGKLPLVSPDSSCEHVERKAGNGAECCANCVHGSYTDGLWECCWMRRQAGILKNLHKN